jgi:hypothetical protein
VFTWLHKAVQERGAWVPCASKAKQNDGFAL